MSLFLKNTTLCLLLMVVLCWVSPTVADELLLDCKFLEANVTNVTIRNPGQSDETSSKTNETHTRPNAVIAIADSGCEVRWADGGKSKTDFLEKDDVFLRCFSLSNKKNGVHESMSGKSLNVNRITGEATQIYTVLYSYKPTVKGVLGPSESKTESTIRWSCKKGQQLF